MKDYTVDPEEEEVNDEDLNDDEEYTKFNYPIGTQLKEDEEAHKDAPLDDEDLGADEESKA